MRAVSDAPRGLPLGPSSGSFRAQQHNQAALLPVVTASPAAPVRKVSGIVVRRRGMGMENNLALKKCNNLVTRYIFGFHTGGGLVARETLHEGKFNILIGRTIPLLRNK